MIHTQKYKRKPLFVEAVRVTEENFLELAFWCKGEIGNIDGSPVHTGQTIVPDQQFIKVRVHQPKNQRQSQARVGDWILHTTQGFKVYLDRAFRNSFEQVGEESRPVEEHELVPSPQQPTEEEPVPEPTQPTEADPIPEPEPVEVPSEEAA